MLLKIPYNLSEGHREINHTDYKLPLCSSGTLLWSLRGNKPDIIVPQAALSSVKRLRKMSGVSLKFWLEGWQGDELKVTSNAGALMVS